MNKLINGQKVRPFNTERSDLIKRRNFLFLAGMFMTMFLLNIGRFYCRQRCLNYGWYQRILYDDIHHYQLGIILLLIAFVLAQHLKRIQTLVFGIGLGLVLDELFFVVELFGLPPYFSQSVVRWAIFDAVAFLIVAAIYQFLDKRETSQLPISGLKSNL